MKFLRLNWVDQIAKEPKKTADFYSALLGFEQSGVDEGDGYTSYAMTDEAGKEIFGIVEEAVFKDWLHGWVAYFEVEDIDRAVKKIESLGGTVVSRRRTQCLFKDPQGTPSVLVQAAAE